MEDTFSEMQMYDVSTKWMHTPFVLHSLAFSRRMQAEYSHYVIWFPIAIQAHGIYHAPAHMPHSTFL